MSSVCRLRKVLESSGTSMLAGWGMGWQISTREGTVGGAFPHTLTHSPSTIAGRERQGERDRERETGRAQCLSPNHVTQERVKPTVCDAAVIGVCVCVCCVNCIFIMSSTF